MTYTKQPGGLVTLHINNLFYLAGIKTTFPEDSFAVLTMSSIMLAHAD